MKTKRFFSIFLVFAIVFTSSLILSGCGFKSSNISEEKIQKKPSQQAGLFKKGKLQKPWDDLIEEVGYKSYNAGGAIERKAENKSYFKSCKGDLILPDDVTDIRYGAFYNCKDLTSVTIPDSVTEIDDWAFAGCTKLKSVVIPDSVIIISEHAFYKCSSLKELDIPDSVTTIGDSAFNNCASIKSVKMGNSVKSFGSSAFYNCKALKSIEVPDTTTIISHRAFMNCKSLSKIKIGKGVLRIEYEAFNNTAYFNKKSNWKKKVLYINDYLIKVKHDISKSYSIKKGTKILADQAFLNCFTITSVNIPSSVFHLGECAFKNCVSLKSVTAPESVSTLGFDVFLGCQALTVYGKSGSKTEIYAKDNNIKFVAE